MGVMEDAVMADAAGSVPVSVVQVLNEVGLLAARERTLAWMKTTAADRAKRAPKPRTTPPQRHTPVIWGLEQSKTHNHLLKAHRQPRTRVVGKSSNKTRNFPRCASMMTPT